MADLVQVLNKFSIKQQIPDFYKGMIDTTMNNLNPISHIIP